MCRHLKEGRFSPALGCQTTVEVSCPPCGLSPVCSTCMGRELSIYPRPHPGTQADVQVLRADRAVEEGKSPLNLWCQGRSFPGRPLLLVLGSGSGGVKPKVSQSTALARDRRNFPAGFPLVGGAHNMNRGRQNDIGMIGMVKFGADAISHLASQRFMKRLSIGHFPYGRSGQQ